MARKEENIRKRSNDYREEYVEILKKQKSIEARIIERTLNLCERYPNVVLDTIDNKTYTGKTIARLIPKSIFDIGRLLDFMSKIEEYIDSLHPHQQGNLFEQ